MNTVQQHSSLMKLIHWVMALQIIALLFLGFYMDGMPWNENKKFLMMMHKSCGVLAVLFIVLRVVLRFSTPMPAPRGTTFIQLMSTATTVLLYVFMAAMAFSGLFMSELGGHPISLFGMIELPHFLAKNVDIAKRFKAVHKYIAWPLVALIVLHFIGALYHRFVLRDDVLGRMLPGSRS